MAMFVAGEKVLCLYGSQLYEAKCLKSRTEDNHISYLIHYVGWKKSYDEWVPENCVFKYNEANVQRQIEMNKQNEHLAKSKRKSDLLLEESNKKTKLDDLDITITNENETNRTDDHETNGTDSETSDIDEEELLCNFCKKIYFDQIDYDKHWQWHILQLEHMQSCCVQLEQVKVFRCYFCKRCYRDEPELKAHRRTHFDFSKRKKADKPKTKNGCSGNTRKFSSQSNHVDNETCNLQLKYKAIFADDNNQRDINGYQTKKIVHNGPNNYENSKIDKSKCDITVENKANKVDDTAISNIDENEPNNVIENETNSLDEYQMNQSKTNDVDRVHMKKIVDNYTNTLDNDETNKVNVNVTSNTNTDENEFNEEKTNMVDKEDTNKRHDNKMSEVTEFNTDKVNGGHTSKVHENQINKTQDNANDVDKDQTNKIDENETIIVQEDDLEKANEVETNEISENETTKVQENDTEKVNEGETHKIDENEVNKAQEEYININEDAANKINENETIEMQKNNKDNMNEDKINKMNKNETNKTQKDDTDKIKTNIIDDNKTNEIHIYTCALCNRKFDKSSEFHKHWQLHNQQIKYMQSCHVILNRSKTFKCVFCTSSFPDQEKLRIHQRKYFQVDYIKKHNNTEKPLKCEVCGWRFVMRSTLEAHSVLHEPFPNMCECGIGYYQKCDLDAHRKLVHPNYKPPELAPLKTKQEDGEEIEIEYKPALNKLGPRLKATLTFKSKNKTQNQKRHSHKRDEPNKTKIIKREISKRPKKSRGESNIKMELETDENGNYTCALCTETFSESKHFVTHITKRHSKKIGSHYKCDVCGALLTINSVKLHLFIHAGIKAYHCHICKKRYSQSGALKLHLLRHTGDRKFHCEICSKTFYTDSCLRLHSRTHTGQKPFECKRCWKSFSDPSAYKRHLLIHTGLKPYKCEQCPKAFCDPSALFRHTRMHQGYKVKCTECDRTFASRSSMFAHLRFTHGDQLRDDEKYHCDLCGRKFTQKHNLKLHMENMHLNRVPRAKCEICHKSCSSAANLKVHIKAVHLKIAKFKCDVCGASFVTKINLQVHQKVHKSERDDIFICDHCRRVCTSKSRLERHITRIHLRIACDMCTISFRTFAQLNQHKSDGCGWCNICKTNFCTPRELEDHQTVAHTKKGQKKVHKCEYCDKRFVLESNLQLHISRHVDPVGNFTCDHCGEVFHLRARIFEHIWSKHMVCLFCNICLKKFFSERDLSRHKRNGRCELREFPCDICDRKFLTTSELHKHLFVHGAKKR